MNRNQRLADLQVFYQLIDRIAQRVGGATAFRELSRKSIAARRGVYFIFDDKEQRSDTGSGPRLVRVGTHALTRGSRSSVSGRLAQHRGTVRTNAGNHRGSIFRLLIGNALIKRDGYMVGSWGHNNTAPADVRRAEHELERAVSQIIGRMAYLCLPIEDEPAPSSLRGFVERSSIALVSNFDREPLDPPSGDWLGHFSDRERVRRSGLWNQNHVEDQAYDPAFLTTMQNLVAEMKGGTA